MGQQCSPYAKLLNTNRSPDLHITGSTFINVQIVLTL